jgi:hypothetical protein
MRWFRRGFLASAFVFVSIMLIAAATRPGSARDGAKEVDVELVLAVDISYSMDLEEQRLQREGYVKALTSPEVLQAIRNGPNGRIAVTYFEWAGANTQRIVVPWQVIDGPETADAFVAKLTAAPISRWYRTSISGAILFGHELFENNGYHAPRRVMDISGDGANNHGITVEDARDRALKAGIVINGLPIMLNNGRRSVFDMTDLDDYYSDCVIGGPGAFMIAITERDQFVSATRQKILREIADLRDPLPDRLRIIPASSSDDDKPARPKVNCRIGERQWEERYRN